MHSPHFRIGDRVQLNGRRAHIVAAAAINGPDWWELELDDEFALVPDGTGGRIRISQAFAPDASLKPVTEESAPAVAPGSFYAIDLHGIVYGPATSVEGATNRATRHGGAGWQIASMDHLADVLAHLDGVRVANYRTRTHSQEVH
jgi:hypothetical protein